MTHPDQPTIFGPELLCAFSDRADGSMLERSQGRLAPAGLEHRRAFVRGIGISYEDVVYQVMSYGEGATYNTVALVDGRAKTANEPNGLSADALITATPGVFMMLPVADCIATALYDPEAQVVASVHLGRHNSVALLADRVVRVMASEFGSRPENIRAWLSPSVGPEHYAMDYFAPAGEAEWHGFAQEHDGKIQLDLAGFNRSRLLAAGLLAEHIEVSGIDVAGSEAYFSHSRGDRDGRMVMVVGLKS